MVVRRKDGDLSLASIIRERPGGLIELVIHETKDGARDRLGGTRANRFEKNLTLNQLNPIQTG